MSESTYRIRVKKFSDLMRDINRQIPLLKEALAKKKKSSKVFDADELTANAGKKVSKVKYGETRIHKHKKKESETKDTKKSKDKGIKAPIKERKVKYIPKGGKKQPKKKQVKKKTPEKRKKKKR